MTPRLGTSDSIRNMNKCVLISATTSRRTLSGLGCAALAVLLTSACDRAPEAQKAKTVAKQPASEAAKKPEATPKAPLEPVAGLAGAKSGAGVTKLDVGHTKPDPAEPAATPAGPKPDVGTAKPEADSNGGGTAQSEDAPADPKALLKEARSRKTTDERAVEALAEAEAAGAKVRDVAKAANKRGAALHKKPERALKFFQWAADKDPKYADPVFAMAKQAVVSGEVDEVVKLLTQVKERRGKKLLQQVGYDPMWEIVKDDPAVRALLK